MKTIEVIPSSGPMKDEFIKGNMCGLISPTSSYSTNVRVGDCINTNTYIVNNFMVASVDTDSDCDLYVLTLKDKIYGVVSVRPVDRNAQFFENLRLIQMKQQLRLAMKFIYSYFDELIIARRLEEVNLILADARVSRLDTRLIVAILMVMKPFRGELKHYSNLVASLEHLLKGKYSEQDIERIVRGFK